LEAVDVSSGNSSMRSTATSFPQSSTEDVEATSVAATEVSTSTSQSNELPTNNADASTSTTPSTTGLLNHPLSTPPMRS
jgi:hypothetical protein